MNLKNRVELLEIIKNDQFISTDKFLSESKNLDYIYAKRDFLFRPGKWRGEIAIPPHFKISNRRYSVVTGHSDLLTDYSDLRKFQMWNPHRKIFGTNTYPKEDVAYSLPLGITNDCDDTPIHRILGATSHFSKAHQGLDFNTRYTGSMYVNFTAENNRQQREELLSTLRGRVNTKFEKPEISHEGRVNYLRELKRHNFVPCPEGNGFDTHRLWETLYMGGIPIVLRNPAINDLVTHLPVINLNSWHDILDSSFLENEWNALQRKDFQIEKLSVRYWLNFISTRSKV